MSIFRRFIILVLLAGYSVLASGADHPKYANGMLTIPRIDTPENIDQFQNAVFTYAGSGLWELSSFTEDSRWSYLPDLVEIDLIRTNEKPVQILLSVHAGFGHGCSTLDHPFLRKADNHFEIRLKTLDFGPGACASAESHEYVTIPLNVYGLEAGTYTYDVNGVAGSFMLEALNVYPSNMSE